MWSGVLVQQRLVYIEHAHQDEAWFQPEAEQCSTRAHGPVVLNERGMWRKPSGGWATGTAYAR